MSRRKHCGGRPCRSIAAWSVMTFLSSNRHPALACSRSMTFPESRYRLSGSRSRFFLKHDLFRKPIPLLEILLGRIDRAHVLLEPEIHVHVAIHFRRKVQTLARGLAPPHAIVEPAKAEMAVRRQRAHAVQFGERQRLPVVSSAALGIELLRMGGEIAQEPQRVGPEARLALGGFDRQMGEPPRLVEPSEPQIGAAHRIVRPAAVTDDSARGLTLEQLLAL